MKPSQTYGHYGPKPVTRDARKDMIATTPSLAAVTAATEQKHGSMPASAGMVAWGRAEPTRAQSDALKAMEDSKALQKWAADYLGR